MTPMLCLALIVIAFIAFTIDMPRVALGTLLVAAGILAFDVGRAIGILAFVASW